jgi:hypothetical protein
MATMVQRVSAPRRGLAGPHAVPDRAFATILFLYLLAVVFPSELAINLFGLALTPVRIVLLALLVPAAARLLADRDFRPQAFDYLLVLSLAWLVLALSVNNGAGKGIQYGGSLALEALGGYLVARAYVRSGRQFAHAVTLYFGFVLAVATIAVPETFLAVRFVHPLASLLTGAVPHDIPEAGRLGLERAASSFDHPILYGVFCASSFGLAWYVWQSRRDVWLRLAAILFATFCAVTSAALLAIAAAIALIVWERWTRPFKQRVAISLAILAAAYLVLELASNRSMVEVAISFVALDPWTAYYRVLIWENAFVDLARSPLLGAALDAWTRPPWMTASVDSYWLVLALSAGLPAVAMLAAMILLMLRRVHARSAAGESKERWAARFGWTAAVLALCLQAFTVHYWGSMNAFFFFVLGLGAWMTERAGDQEAPAPGPHGATGAKLPFPQRGTILQRLPRVARRGDHAPAGPAPQAVGSRQ